MDERVIHAAEVVPAQAGAVAQRLEEPITLVILGATGDLTARKLVPALYSLWRDRCLPPSFFIVGVGRREKTDAQFRADLQGPALANCRVQPASPAEWESFASRICYQRMDFQRTEDFRAFSTRLAALEREQGLGAGRLFYLATTPDLFAPLVEQLSVSGLVQRNSEKPWTRLVIEKPFGKDLASARQLDRHILHFLREEQVFRIDHYLGKETVQNVLCFRFGNAIFEPLFNRQYVDHVQITAAESIGMEGRRGAFYDGTGALRDMVQSHLLQLLALVAMEPPAVFGAKEIRDEKVKLLQSLVPLDGGAAERCAVRGQYGPGQVQGKSAPGYRQEEGVRPDSTTETYAAVRLHIDNWRWAGVPFLLRTGKRLGRRLTEVAVHFKLPPLRLFATVNCEGNSCEPARPQANVLVFRIQPDEGIDLGFSAKRLGDRLDLQPVRMEFDYQELSAGCLPDAYERLLLDALQGDATLFMRSDEVEAAWEWVTPILQTWERQPPPGEFPNYPAGSWGPAEADRLAEGCGHGWRTPSR